MIKIRLDPTLLTSMFVVGPANGGIVTAHGAYTVNHQKWEKDKALAMCSLLGGHLPITDTSFEHMELVDALRHINFTQGILSPLLGGAWFGIISKNRAFTWVHTGKSASNPENGYVNWAAGQISTPGLGKMCSLWHNGFVSMCFCEIKLKVICEYETK